MGPLVILLVSLCVLLVLVVVCGVLGSCLCDRPDRVTVNGITTTV